MRAFLLRRLLHAVFVTWGVVTVVFFLVRLTGDPTLFLVDQSATQEEIAHTRALLGLDRPLAVQYVDFLAGAVRGDFGLSIREKRPAMRMVLEHFWPATVELAADALLLSTALAVPLGVISATHRGRAADHASRIASLFLQSMPSFWLGVLSFRVLAGVLGGPLPAYGTGTWRHLVLPAVALAAAPLAQNVRLVRAGMLEVLGQDYVRTARAKGLAEPGVVYRHALRNAALPVITVAGLSLGFMLSGALIIETVFASPGMGRLIVQAVLGRDVASRLLHGARVSLVVGFSAVLLAGVVGVGLGLVSGWYRGWLDDLLMRLGDVQLAFPVLVLAVAVLAVLGASVMNLILVLGVTGWITYARIVRGEVLTLRERDFVAAARALGADDAWILRRHLLPNVLPPITVVATFSVARTIIAEASLSFLGLGIPAPEPSWGAMLDEGRHYITTGWWLALFPGLAILLLVLGINLVGDWLRDVLDPRLERGL